MSESKSKKYRIHAIRNGVTDPSFFRGNWNGINPVTKTTPTKKTSIEKNNTKHRNQIY